MPGAPSPHLGVALKVTAELAKGRPVAEAFRTAHLFLRAALEQSFPFNDITGPVYHHALAKLLHGE